MFILGVIVGVFLGMGAMVLLRRKEQGRLRVLEAERSAHFRRVTELERQLAESRALVASVKRDERLRSQREFGQYKILLRRADSALAQARQDLGRLDALRHAA
ncbi:MAG: hypothetical protein HKN03_18780 [Acidimicrobiales bacterium]|nr:hypothetical protein [Acidimicrobiales bacterium]